MRRAAHGNVIRYGDVARLLPSEGPLPGETRWPAVGSSVRLFDPSGALVAIAFHSVFDNLFVHGVSVQMGALLGLAQQVSQRAGPPERGAPASGEQPASAT
uniref:Uncharacterized protein n=1 Tax=Thermorudis sp. TaxID=1969470 RepID=A0A7C3ANS6_9BACT